MVKLDIISDVICPWCYIGKAHLDRALEAAPDHPFTIEWHPFQLNPTMPEGGMDRREYLEHKFGGKEGAVRVYAQIAEAGEAAGLEIDFSAIQRTPNTINAHRLIHWAGLEGRQTAIVSKLFRAYFKEGRDIGDIEVLLDVAEAAEMDREMVARLMATDQDIDDIRARDANARERGVTGVPTFVVANQHVLPGAQQPELWANVIEEINAQLAAQP
ncbi:DsbA family oxidoreductase [Litoreibacter arenae]|uniref:2-hydroxychromene-2-carboxylate isomerase/putative DsbA thioredoxin domain protein n=1 Tax=Litoreibacter arenae DSM 19593 TaxID=1123360 RepID=S9S287_9RHOB|nr:DsbA family oxidoreductase [Litoreibacter arenae]EPX80329.1 2-hydroxychromene-2-carboxylate isomerase/putative DsbA thioredoxin domain protein [Litoreibacter arenae DSM 19593]